MTTLVPPLLPIAEGQWQARCQFCKAESPIVAATSQADAWTALCALEWGPYVSVPGAIPRTLCKRCVANNASLMEAVAQAKSGRRRK